MGSSLNLSVLRRVERGVAGRAAFEVAAGRVGGRGGKGVRGGEGWRIGGGGWYSAGTAMTQVESSGTGRSA